VYERVDYVEIDWFAVKVDDICYDLFVISDWDFPDADSIICGNQDGINQEIFILCSINRWLCQSRCEMDRLWASLHTILAAYSSLGRGVLIAWVCRRCLAPVVLLGYSKEGTAQGFHEEGIKGCLVLLCRQIDALLISYICRLLAD